MVAIRVHFDGKALIPEGPVDLPRDRTLIVHVDTDVEDHGSGYDNAALRAVVAPSDPDAARRLIEDAEIGLENA